MPLNPEQDLPAIQGLGNNISTAIMLNTRAKVAQARIASQYASDYEQAELRKMQQLKLQQEVSDLMDMQRRIKSAGNMFAADKGNPNLQGVGEVIASSPSAMTRYVQGVTVNPGQERHVPFGAPIVSKQPRMVGLNQSLVGQDGIEQTGLVGGQSTGIYKPGESEPMVKGAPRYSTPQGDVEQLREFKRVMAIPVVELEKMEEMDAEQFAYTIQMRKKAREMLGVVEQGGTNAPTYSVPSTNAAPRIRKYNPTTGRIE